MTYISDKPTWEMQREIDTLTAALSYYKGRTMNHTTPRLTWQEFIEQMAEQGVLLSTEPDFDYQPVIRTESGDYGVAACHREQGRLVIDLGQPI